MALLSVLASSVHLLQLVVSLYTAFVSYTSIRRVQTYESATETAAKYSNAADSHLQTTRTTQGAGAVSVLLSTLLSAYLLVFAPTGSSWWSFALCGTVAVFIERANSHIAGYWRGKWKVPLPGSGDYNDAITSSNQMRQILGGLMVSWGVCGVGYFLAAITGR